MDEETLKALKSFTNFGYSLAHRRNGKWFGDDPENEEDKTKTNKTNHEEGKKSHGNLLPVRHLVRKFQRPRDGTNAKGQADKIEENSSLRADQQEEDDKNKNKKPNPSRKRKQVKKSHVYLDQLQVAKIQTSTDHATDIKRQKGEMEQNWSFKAGPKSRWWIFLFSMILQMIYISFLILQCSHVLSDKHTTAKDKLQIFYLSGLYFIFNYFSVVIFSNFEHLATYLNAVKDTVTSIHFPSSAAASLKTRSIKFFISYSMAFLIFVVFVRGSAPFLQPGSRLAVTSLAQIPEQLPIWVKILASIFHAHVSCFSGFSGGVFMITTLWYVASVLPVLERTKFIKNDKPLDPDFLYSSYYRLTVLQNNLKVTYGEAVLTLELGVIFISCGNFYLAVAHADISGLLKAGFISYLAKVLFSKLSHIHTVSVEVVDSWNRKLNEGAAVEGGKNQFLWFEKFLMSTRPLRMYVGNFFYVDKTFVLTLIQIIITQTASLILSFK